MRKKFVNAMMALALAFGRAFVGAQHAPAREGGVGVGVAAGIIGLGILGAAAARDYDRPRYYSRYDEGCFRGRRECHWTDRRCFENEFGDTVCRGGRYLANVR